MAGLLALDAGRFPAHSLTRSLARSFIRCDGLHPALCRCQLIKPGGVQSLARRCAVASSHTG